MRITTTPGYVKKNIKEAIILKHGKIGDLYEQETRTSLVMKQYNFFRTSVYDTFLFVLLSAKTRENFNLCELSLIISFQSAQNY